VAAFRKAKTNKSAAFQLWQVREELGLCVEPSLIFGDDFGAGAVASDDEGISPRRSAADVDRAGGDAVGVLVEVCMACLSGRVATGPVAGTGLVPACLVLLVAVEGTGLH